MQTGLTTGFSHVKPQDTSLTRGGLRDFFVYRDLEIVRGTRWSRNIRANLAPKSDAGWHPHEADFHIVSML